MLIGIDASRAVTTQKTGTEHYSEQIIYNISKLDHKNQYILFSENAPKKGSLLADLPNNFTWKIIPFGYLWTQIRLSLEMLKWKNKLDVLFVPAHTIPLIHPKNVVVTIHDLGFEYFPELYAKKPIGPNNTIVKLLLNIGVRIITLGKYGNSEYDYHRWAIRHAISNATKIISISKFTKNDIVNKYNAEPSQISIIYHGFDTSNYRSLKNSSNPKKSTETTKKYKPYLFYIGRVEHKKNIKRLFEAFAKLKTKYKISEKLILAGMPGLGYDEIKKYKLTLPKNIQKDIIELGYTSQEDVEYFMQNAKAFVFPTIFEGFGMPILEAFASEIPVVCSNTTACPEIAGDSAILVDPKDSNNIADGIYKIINSNKLSDKLINDGKKRVQNFSWEKASQKTLDIIINSAKTK